MSLRPNRCLHTVVVVVVVVAFGALSSGCGGEPDTSDPAVASEAAVTSRRKPPRPPAPTPPPPPAPTPPPPSAGSAICPGSDGTCASFGQSRLVCTNNGGQYSCTAPAGANVCVNGQVCPQGTVCGDIYTCPSEGGSCYLGCYSGGPLIVYDGATGAACQAVDAHGVTHVCASALCSGGTPSVCLPANPPPRPPINEG